MLKNNVEQFTESLFQFITGKTEIRGLLVKKHSDNFHIHGEFSFTNSLKSWHGCINADPDSLQKDITLLQYLKKNEHDIVEESKNWMFQLKHVKTTNDRVYLFLERIPVIFTGLKEGLHNNLIISKIERRPCYVKIDPECEKTSDITSLRVKYLAKVVDNLTTLINDCDKLPDIVVSSKSCNIGGTTVICGAVLNAKTNLKEFDIDANEFIRLRQTEMTLIAQHKYGARVSTDEKWKNFVAHLGESAVAFELLQCKPSSAVKINFDNVAAGSSKGVSFILYNCARLETIIRTFNGKVDEGIYPPLPEFEDTDFTLLTEEDEWHLVFNYVLSFSSMLAQCVEINESRCEFRPHYICQFLNGMVRVISQYYRKTRILLGAVVPGTCIRWSLLAQHLYHPLTLVTCVQRKELVNTSGANKAAGFPTMFSFTEPRQHLLPLVFARLHMIVILNNILKNCLKILNIKSVSQM